MKLWLSKNSEVPMREQLVTQITLGIASGDLQSGEKLPSRGEIARRFEVHANTVSNAYQELAEKNLIEFRTGSGFYVCEAKVENNVANGLDNLIAKFLNDAKTLGFSNQEIQNSLEKHFTKNYAKNFMVVESDFELCEILIEEIKQTTNAGVSGISFEDFKQNFQEIDGLFIALSDEEEKIKSVLPTEKHCIFLKTNSVIEAMKDETRPTEDSLIALCSGWENFLLMAKTMLVAAKIDADSIILRQTSEANWQRGLENVSMIICDSLTKKKLSNQENVRPFSLIAESSLNDLKSLLTDK